MSESAETPADVAAYDIPIPGVICWRCGLISPNPTRCLHCSAPLVEPALNPNNEAASYQTAFKSLLISFAILLASGIAHGVILSFVASDVDAIDESLRHQLLTEMLAVEVFDSIVIAIVITTYGAHSRLPKPSSARKKISWALSLPVLAGLLAFNLLYHWILRTYLQVPWVEEELAEKIDWRLILVFCVQPAIVEEFYFRGFALGTLEKVTKWRTAVWISALMFGMAHLAVPLSIPYLVVFGVVIGLVRVNCGTISFLP
jgi:membrane protease YdiL (CAAX protease family)